MSTVLIQSRTRGLIGSAVARKLVALSSGHIEGDDCCELKTHLDSELPGVLLIMRNVDPGTYTLRNDYTDGLTIEIRDPLIAGLYELDRGSE